MRQVAGNISKLSVLREMAREHARLAETWELVAFYRRMEADMGKRIKTARREAINLAIYRETLRDVDERALYDATLAWVTEEERAQRQVVNVKEKQA